MLLDTGSPVTCKNKRTRMSPTSSKKKAWRAVCVNVLSFIFASIMSAERNPTGYEPRKEFFGGYGRLIFDGNERKYEQWEVKFLGYM